MKSPQHKQEESSNSVIQRLVNRKKFTNKLFNSGNKTAQERRLNEFYKEKEEKKGKQ